MARFKISYGWLMVMVASLSMVATLPGRTVGLGLVAEPLMQDLGLTRGDFARHNMIATLVGSLFALLAGRLVDCLGIRLVLSMVLLLLAAMVMAMSQWVTAGTIVVFLILTRGIGQSALSTVSVTTVGKWFADRLVVAMGVFSVLVAIGFVIAIVASQAQIETRGWRAVWFAIGAAIAGLGVVTAVAARDKGRADESSGRAEEKSTTGRDNSLTLQEALRTGCFWIFGIGMALYGGVLAAVSLFNESILAELGFGAMTFRYAMAGLMVGGLAGNVGAALAARYFSLPRIMAVSLALLAIVMLFYEKLSAPWQVIAHGSLYGLCGGVFSVLFFTGFAKAFGREHLGKIQGCAQAFAVVASALGPWWLAGRQESSGTYFTALSILAPVFATVAVAAWFVRMPRTGQYSGQ